MTDYIMNYTEESEYTDYCEYADYAEDYQSTDNLELPITRDSSDNKIVPLVTWDENTPLELPDSLCNITLDSLEALVKQSNAHHAVYKTGIKQLDYLVSGGIPPGQLILLAAKAGFGKSSILVTALNSMIRMHDDVIVIACIIDDTPEAFIARWLAMMAKIPIDAVEQLSLRESKTEYMTKYSEAVGNFRENILKRLLVFGADDLRQISKNSPDPIENISEKIKETYSAVRTRSGRRPQIIVMIDSPRDLRVKSPGVSSNADAIDFIGSGLKNMLTIHAHINGVSEPIRPIIWTTEHLRKLPRDQKRPTLEDLKDTIELSYRANLVLMLWNDMVYNVQMRKTDVSPMMFERRDLTDPRTGLPEKDAVIELTVCKSKVGRTHYGASSTVLFKFYQEQSYAAEITDRNEFLTYIAQME